MRAIQGHDLTNGLVGLWVYEDANATPENRIGGKQSTVSAGTITTTDTPYGKAGVFGGSAFLNNGSDPLLRTQTPLSIVAFVKVGTQSASGASIYTNDERTTASGVYSGVTLNLPGTSGVLEAAIGDNVSGGASTHRYTWTSPSSVVTNNTYHLLGVSFQVATGSAPTALAQLYVDGKPVSTGVAAASPGFTSIGYNAGGFASVAGTSNGRAAWNGDIHWIGQWNRALHDEEHLALFTQTIEPILYKRPGRRLLTWGKVGATAYSLDLTAGSVAITGFAATLAGHPPLSASPASFAVTGAAATLATGRVLVLDATTSAFAITGAAATLTLLTAGHHELNALAGAVAINGASATLTVTRSGAVGRVNIAFDAGPLDPTPVWTTLDQGGAFPAGFVSGYDITTGRQTLISQTDTGTATVYINDQTGLFDPNNASSPYYGKLQGRQILLQLYNPVAGEWQSQFRGLIDDYLYDVDGSAANSSGAPVNVAIQIECVDIFDYLAGYGLTPGLDGVTPPAGSEESVYYAATAGKVDDRIIELLTDVGIDSTMWTVASGNVKLQEAKYNADESALTVLRDCADAEIPFIANIYVDRHGVFAFRGRYSRFVPDLVSAEPGSDWDFHRWKVGAGTSLSDTARAPMRVLSYTDGRTNIINAAIAYPQGIDAADIPGQVYADTTSITSHGKHTPPGPMSDLFTQSNPDSGNNANQETQLFAKLLVKNQKDPRPSVTALQVKSVSTAHSNASATWELLTKADISDIVNVKAGYPGGTGFSGAATVDDYYIEGRQMRVRPANTSYDYVELDLELSPFVWSADTHSVFPAFGS